MKNLNNYLNKKLIINNINNIEYIFLKYGK